MTIFIYLSSCGVGRSAAFSSPSGEEEISDTDFYKNGQNYLSSRIIIYPVSEDFDHYI